MVACACTPQCGTCRAVYTVRVFAMHHEWESVGVAKHKNLDALAPRGVEREPLSGGGGIASCRTSPRGRVQTLMQRTWKRRQALCRCVRQSTCRSMKMRVLETERTSSPKVNITAYIQPRGPRSNGTFQSLRGQKLVLERWCG